MGQLLPLCLPDLKTGGNDTSLLVTPTWGRFVKSTKNLPIGGIFPSFRRGKHRTRLVAGRRKNRAEARTHFNTEETMKNRKLSIRISEADLKTIHHKAEKANMTLTDYVTACCLGKEIVVIHGLDEVIRQQKGIGRNLNQLTTLANMGKVKIVYLQELTDAYAAVSSLLSDILKRRRWP